MGAERPAADRFLAGISILIAVRAYLWTTSGSPPPTEVVRLVPITPVAGGLSRTVARSIDADLIEVLSQPGIQAVPATEPSTADTGYLVKGEITTRGRQLRWQTRSLPRLTSTAGPWLQPHASTRYR